MTNEEITVLAVVGCILVLSAIAVLGAQAVFRRWQVRRRPQRAARAEQPPNTRPPVVLGPVRPVRLEPNQAQTMIPRGLPLVIPRRETPLWQEKGWRRNGHGYEGLYRAGGRQWRGVIQVPYPGSFDAYIWNPPLAELDRRTSHRPCFNLSGIDGRFKIHFHTMPASLDHSIASIEAVLTQAMGVR